MGHEASFDMPALICVRLRECSSVTRLVDWKLMDDDVPHCTTHTWSIQFLLSWPAWPLMTRNTLTHFPPWSAELPSFAYGLTIRTTVNEYFLAAYYVPDFEWTNVTYHVDSAHVEYRQPKIGHCSFLRISPTSVANCSVTLPHTFDLNVDVRKLHTCFIPVGPTVWSWPRTQRTNPEIGPSLSNVLYRDAV